MHNNKMLLILSCLSLPATAQNLPPAGHPPSHVQVAMSNNSQINPQLTAQTTQLAQLITQSTTQVELLRQTKESLISEVGRLTRVVSNLEREVISLKKENEEDKRHSELTIRRLSRQIYSLMGAVDNLTGKSNLEDLKRRTAIERRLAEENAAREQKEYESHWIATARDQERLQAAKDRLTVAIQHYEDTYRS